nr:hypothetical protein [Tanacetum cinerariifolium]
MELSTKLSDRVLDLEKIKIAQAKEIVDLKKRVKKLERKRRRIDGIKRLLSAVEVTAAGYGFYCWGGLLGLKDFLVLLKLLLLAMVSTADED